MRARIVKKLIACVIVAGIGALALPQQSHATILGGWTFDVNPPVGNAGPLAADIGTGQGFLNTGGTISSPVGNGTTNSWSSNGWDVGDYFQFSTDTTLYEDITIRWDHTSSGTGPRDFQLSWSLDGVNFTNLGAEYMVLTNASPIAWTSAEHRPEHSFGPVAAPAALDDQPVVYFRLTNTSTVSANGGTVGSAGTSRVDTVMIEGTLIPEPATLSLLATAGLLALRRRRA